MDTITTTQTLNYIDWDTKVRCDYALKIEDILKLKPGDQIKVLCMDRNVYDAALQEDIRGKSLSPQKFFESNWAIYIHEKDLKGALLFEFEIEDDNLDLVDMTDICQSDFEFHVEYETKHSCWYPLENGYLPASDPQGFSNFSWNEKKHWSEFPLDTKVGYRGPMILWSNLDKMPNVIYPFSEDQIEAFENENDITSERLFHINTDSKLVNILCTKFDIESSFTAKWTVGNFCWHLRDMFKEYGLEKQFPYSFNVVVTETTKNSKGLIWKYSVTCEKDGDENNGMIVLGRNVVKEIKN